MKRVETVYGESGMNRDFGSGSGSDYVCCAVAFDDGDVDGLY